MTIKVSKFNNDNIIVRDNDFTVGFYNIRSRTLYVEDDVISISLKQINSKLKRFTKYGVETIIKG